MTRIISFLIVFTVCQASVFSQVNDFDQLEMRYDQHQYKAVYKKAKRLMDKPEYDYSFIPRYYVALSSLQLAQNKNWYKRNKQVIPEAAEAFKDIYSTLEGKRLLEAHLYELSALKSDMYQWMYSLDQEGDKKTFLIVQDFVTTLFKNIPEVESLKQDHLLVEDSPIEGGNTGDDNDTEEAPAVITNISERQQLLNATQGLQGIPYKYGGTTTNGFDCSGFVCYVFNKGLQEPLQRSAAEQYKNAKKIKAKNVQPGDLVFFNTSSGVSHVGIVYSTENNSIQMIHASTSIGVSIVDIYESSYWKKRIVGFGTTFQD